MKHGNKSNNSRSMWNRNRIMRRRRRGNMSESIRRTSKRRNRRWSWWKKMIIDCPFMARPQLRAKHFPIRMVSDSAFDWITS